MATVMPVEGNIEIRENLSAALASLPPDVQLKGLPAAFNAAGTVVLRGVRNRYRARVKRRSGALFRSIRLSKARPYLSLRAAVVLAGGRRAPHAHLIEDGTEERRYLRSEWLFPGRGGTVQRTGRVRPRHVFRDTERFDSGAASDAGLRALADEVEKAYGKAAAEPLRPPPGDTAFGRAFLGGQIG